MIYIYNVLDTLIYYTTLIRTNQLNNNLTQQLNSIFMSIC